MSKKPKVLIPEVLPPEGKEIATQAQAKVTREREPSSVELTISFLGMPVRPKRKKKFVPGNPPKMVAKSPYKTKAEMLAAQARRKAREEKKALTKKKASRKKP